MAPTSTEVKPKSDSEEWYSISKLIVDPQKRLEQAGLREHIANIFSWYKKLDPEWKDLLKPFNVKEDLDAIKKFDRDILVYQLEERVTDPDKRIHRLKLKNTLEKLDADMVVCMVQLVYDVKSIKVTEGSLDILRHCLLSRSNETEILIDNDQSIHASEAKFIVFETLNKLRINKTKTVYHAAETDLEGITLDRVLAVLESSQQVIQSLRSSLPELSDIQVMTDYAFQKHLNKSSVAEIAKSIILWDDKKRVGNVSSGSMVYNNSFKVRQFQTQIVEECSKTITNQISSTVTENLSSHILGNLELDLLKKHSHISREDFTFQRYRKIFDSVATDLGAAFVIEQTTVFGPIAAIISAPLLVGSMLSVLLYPVNVNDPEWRVNCIHDIIVKFEKKKKKIFFDTTTSVEKLFEKMSKELKPLTKTINFPEAHRYDVATFEGHKKMKSICSSEMCKEELRKNVKKVIIGRSNGNIQAHMYLKQETATSAEIHKLIILQQIGRSTNEEKQIHKFTIENKPRISQALLGDIKKIISEETKRLFTLHSNLSIIGPSPVKSSDKGKSVEVCPCIVLFCIGKGFIPIGEPLFPKTLQGIAIDVREGYFTPFVCDQCSVGQYGTLFSGSHGFRASKAGNPAVQGFITAAHVLFNGDVLCQTILNQRQYVSNTITRVVAPSDQDSQSPEKQRLYGIVSDIYFGQCKYQNRCVGIDAAFVQKQNGTREDLNFHIPQGNISPPTFSFEYLDGKKAVKCGRTTNLTTGLIMYDCIGCKYEKIPNHNFQTLQNQYQIISNDESIAFIKPGDSGSGVYLEQDRSYSPIGIAIASHDDGISCVVTPIKYILKSLDLEMYPADMETES